MTVTEPEEAGGHEVEQRDGRAEHDADHGELARELQPEGEVDVRYITVI